MQAQRDAHYVVQQEVLKKGRRALLIAGAPTCFAASTSTIVSMN